MKSAEHGNAKKLIFDALHLDRSRPNADSIATMTPADWDFISGMAKLHRLGPMLHHRLAGLADVVPETVWDRLKASQRRHAMRNLKIYRELVTVTRILNDAGIASIALKGAYLARFAYPDPGLRSMRDLDLLIRPEQVVDAFELLKARGYAAVNDGTPEAYFAERRHLPPLVSPDGLHVELHHRLISEDHLAFSADFDETLWARSVRREIAGIPIGFLCPEDLLLHLCIHAAHEHRLNVGPLALADVALLVGTHEIDWQDFVARAADGNWQRSVLSLLHLARLHLGAMIPGKVIDALGGADDLSWLEAAEYLVFSDFEEHNLLTEHVRNAMYSGSLSGKLASLAKVAFTSRAMVAQEFPVAVDSPRVFLYYPLRWHRQLTRKLPALLRRRGGKDDASRRLCGHLSTFGSWLEAGRPK